MLRQPSPLIHFTAPHTPLPQWVEELFAAVPGGRGPRPRYGFAGLPYEGGRLYLLPAVRDEHRLTASFQLPCLEGQYRWVEVWGPQSPGWLSCIVPLGCVCPVPSVELCIGCLQPVTSLDCPQKKAEHRAYTTPVSKKAGVSFISPLSALQEEG